MNALQASEVFVPLQPLPRPLLFLLVSVCWVVASLWSHWAWRKHAVMEEGALSLTSAGLLRIEACSLMFWGLGSLVTVSQDSLDPGFKVMGVWGEYTAPCNLCITPQRGVAEEFGGGKIACVFLHSFFSIQPQFSQQVVCEAGLLSSHVDRPSRQWARRCVQPVDEWTLTFGLRPYTLQTIHVQFPEVIFGLWDKKLYRRKGC